MYVDPREDGKVHCNTCRLAVIAYQVQRLGFLKNRNYFNPKKKAIAVQFPMSCYTREHSGIELGPGLEE